MQPPGQPADAAPKAYYLAEDEVLVDLVHQSLAAMFEHPVPLDTMVQYGYSSIQLVRLAELLRDQYSNDTCKHF